MKAIDIVKKLRSEGHKISIYKRPDGGIRVTKVDGIKFSKGNSEGTNYIRELAKVNLSEKQYTQRRKNEQAARDGKRRQKAKMPSLTFRKGDSKETRKNKRAVKKALKRARKYRTVNMRQVSQRLKREGYGSTIKALENISRKESGLAYPANVDNLGDFIKMVLADAGQTTKGETIANKCYRNNQWFADTGIQRANSVLYMIQKVLRDAWAGDGSINMTEIIGLINQLNTIIEMAIIDGERIYKDIYGK